LFKTAGRLGAHDEPMSDTARQYRKLADDFATTVAEVGDDQWSAPSPCEGWTARDVVRHMIENHEMFLGLVGRTLGDIPSVDDDPAAAFAAACDVVAADLEDPERAKASYDGYFGRTTFAESIDRFMLGELLVHRWDLGQAIGVDVHFEPDEIAKMFATVEGYGDASRTNNVFGPPLDPPPDADDQTRLLAFTGRKSW
jgi:uncharacterized protein (TIGR03086 family)